MSISPLDVDNDDSEALRGIEDELNHKPRDIEMDKIIGCILSGGKEETNKQKQVMAELEITI